MSTSLWFWCKRRLKGGQTKIFSSERAFWSIHNHRYYYHIYLYIYRFLYIILSSKNQTLDSITHKFHWLQWLHTEFYNQPIPRQCTGARAQNIEVSCHIIIIIIIVIIYHIDWRRVWSTVNDRTTWSDSNRKLPVLANYLVLAPPLFTSAQ